MSNTHNDNLNQQQFKNIQQQDTLGDDDEFEDFPTENWNESESDISSLLLMNNNKKLDKNKKQENNNDNQENNNKNKKVTMDDLWEDNWDDDVIESDFANQLRSELEKTKSSSAVNNLGPTPMQT
ncbi:hypothetical protein O181_069751 [Austropuccinia psidii MF-1]|uniref:26S proteasome complex subunit SEM1 n=1 Tax=Austropuccinia psidii MF-1 TaxID=1389203 RepID=A0A9Q3I527_9BASI|nr:hypothetical protein [Austropuccinia psidii MF-1]